MRRIRKLRRGQCVIFTAVLDDIRLYSTDLAGEIVFQVCVVGAVQHPAHYKLPVSLYDLREKVAGRS